MSKNCWLYYFSTYVETTDFISVSLKAKKNLEIKINKTEHFVRCFLEKKKARPFCVRELFFSVYFLNMWGMGFLFLGFLGLNDNRKFRVFFRMCVLYSYITIFSIYINIDRFVHCAVVHTNKYFSINFVVCLCRHGEWYKRRTRINIVVFYKSVGRETQ